MKNKFLIISLIIVLVLVAFFLLQNLLNSETNTPTAAPTALSTPIPAINDLEVKSSDGKMKLVMKTENLKDVTTYSFFISSNSAMPQTPFFTKTVGKRAAMTIPTNAWSTTNKYIYLQENTNEAVNIYLFKSTGDTFPNGEKYYNVTAMFAKLNSPYSFLEATGWASETLLVINTVNTNDPKTRGASYWFEVPSANFIPLATKF